MLLASFMFAVGLIMGTWAATRIAAAIRHLLSPTDRNEDTSQGGWWITMALSVFVLLPAASLLVRFAYLNSLPAPVRFGPVVAPESVFEWWSLGAATCGLIALGAVLLRLHGRGEQAMAQHCFFRCHAGGEAIGEGLTCEF